MSAVGTTLLQSPGYTQTKSNIELRRSGTITRAFVLRLGSAAPLGLNRCVPIINPGLAPWAMQEYRPYRAPLHLPNQFTLLLLTSLAIVIDYCITFVVRGCRLIPKGNAPRSSRVLKDLGFYFTLVSSTTVIVCN